MVNEHNGQIPRDFWLEGWEIKTIKDFFLEHPEVGYRRLTYMMMDRGILAVSPATTYRVLRDAGMLGQRKGAPSRKGRGFHQPSRPHQHWHTDISYLNISGTFYYLCTILDGYSRYLIHWEIRESMKEQDVEIVLQRARERYPTTRPRLISDNGPQFTARDFKEFIRQSGMTHVRTSPYYPQSNGKQERWYKTAKSECIRPKTPTSLRQARRIVADFVKTYNQDRLHSALGYITPFDQLHGNGPAIFRRREAQLAEARHQRRQRRLLAREHVA